MVKIKICGIKRIEDIQIINKYKPDYIGFVFADSKRKVTYKSASKLKQKLNSNIIPIGVFTDSPQKEILKLYQDNVIEIAQLHGNETEQYIHDLKQKTNNQLKIIKAIEMTSKSNIQKYNDSKADYLLLDSGKGSGKTFNWNLIPKNLKKEIFIAGGLNNQNITQLIKQFNPYAIDLSSSLETNGYKDEIKIKKIMEVIN